MPSLDLQQDLLNNIQDGLDKVRTELNTPMLFGHLCKGDLRSPGVLRVSKVISSNTLEVEGEIFDGHDKALLNHVKRFGREKTLLNWLVCWTRATLDKKQQDYSNIFLTASFMIHDDDQKPLIYHDKNKNTDYTVSIFLSKNLLKTLIPDDVGKRYVKSLYQDNDKSSSRSNDESPSGFFDINQDELELLSAIKQALRMLEECDKGKECFQMLCRNYKPKVNRDQDPVTDAEMLQLLSALQIAFAYAKFFAPNSVKNGGLVSVSRPHPNSLSKDVENNKIPILALSTSVESREEAKHQKALAEAMQRDPLSGVLHKASENLGADSANSEKLCERTRFPYKSVEQLKAILQNSIPEPPFENWSNEAAVWIAHLLSFLRGAKHEGGALEFTFVLGDMAKIEDSSALELLPLKDAGFDFPPQDGLSESKKITALEKAKKAIEKENYFWFQGGRYALLWDFTSPEKQPRHLLGLNDSSWHVFIANARNRKKQTTEGAALVVGYLDDRDGGGLIVSGDHVFSLTQDGEWIQRGDALSNHVENYLKVAGQDILNDKEINLLVRAINAISNDPELGCMLVVSNSGKLPQFETMGQPWQVGRINQVADSHEIGERLLDLRDELLVAMLGMDGAACIWKENDECRIAFRKLARPPAPNEKARPEHKDSKDKLSGEGSRKWSAYFAATREDVNLIIAVSQDGPVHFYAPFAIAETAYNGTTRGASFTNAKDGEVIHDEIS